MEEPEAAEPPPQVVSVDQVVAHNIRYWRRVAGMTQEQLGSLVHLTAANVSAVERSAEPDRERRRFSAQALAEFATALGVPLTALFLPPLDDGAGTRYALLMPDGSGSHYEDMTALLTLAMPDSDDDTGVTAAYQERLTLAVERYLGPSWTADVAAWLNQRKNAAELAERLRARQGILLDLAAELGNIAGGIESELEPEDE